jgi:hypothetical protein
MLKLILLAIVGFFIYKIFFDKKPILKNNDLDENDLIECGICHTFVPKNECIFIEDKCICKDCR